MSENKLVYLGLIVICAVGAGTYFLDYTGPEINKDFERTKFETEVVLYDNKKALSEAYREHQGEEAPDRQGWAGWATDEPYCQIHVVELKGQYDEENLIVYGDELAHCIWGSWHPEKKEY